MLTDQQVTENIEIDDEPVEQNTAHSLFFDTYYKSLADIELVNRQLLDLHSNLNSITDKITQEESKITQEESSIAHFKHEISRLEKSRDNSIGWGIGVLVVFLLLVAYFGIVNVIIFSILLIIVMSCIGSMFGQ